MRQSTITVLFMFSMTCLLISCNRPLLYDPSFDPSPVLSLDIPEHVNNLAAVPRDETHVENGINKHTGRRQPADIKEMFSLDFPNGRYHFTLYFSAESAAKGYEFDKKHGESNNPVFSESGNGFRRAYVHHTERPRSSPETYYRLYDYYTSSCGFQLQNIYVTIGVNHDEQESEALNQAIENLADLISKAVSQNTVIPNKTIEDTSK